MIIYIRVIKLLSVVTKPFFFRNKKNDEQDFCKRFVVF